MTDDDETITQQLALLAQHRQTLTHLLSQAAQYGGAVFAPPATANGIAQARADIQRIKETLRAGGVAVEDAPGDAGPPQVTSAFGAHHDMIANRESGARDYSKLIDFGNATIHGGVTLEHIAHGNITELNINIVSPDDIAKIDITQATIALIHKLQDEVTALSDIPESKRQNAIDDLCKARQASQEGGRDRLLEKLKSAQEILFTLGSVPAARKLSETISTLIQRITEA